MKISKRALILSTALTLLTGIAVIYLAIFISDPCGTDQFEEFQAINPLVERIHIPQILRNMPDSNVVEYSCGHYYTCNCTVYKKRITFDSPEEKLDTSDEIINYLQEKNYQQLSDGKFCNTQNKQECVYLHLETGAKELLISFDSNSEI